MSENLHHLSSFDPDYPERWTPPDQLDPIQNQYGNPDIMQQRFLAWAKSKAKPRSGDRSSGGWQALLPTWKYSPYTISVVAGRPYYSEPRKWLPTFGEYTQYEVAVLDPGEGLAGVHRIKGFDTVHRLFEPGDSPVAGWVNQDDLFKIWMAANFAGSDLYKLARAKKNIGTLERFEKVQTLGQARDLYKRLGRDLYPGRGSKAQRQDAKWLRQELERRFGYAVRPTSNWITPRKKG